MACIKSIAHVSSFQSRLRSLYGLYGVVIKRGTGNEEMGNGETWK